MAGVVQGVPLRIVSLAVTLACLLTGAFAQAARADVGISDWTYPSTLRGPATSSKPESKLWFNDARWWASMPTPAGQHTIHRLSGGTWVDTGTTLDPRVSSRDDVLWDQASGKLYVASHAFTEESAKDGTGADGQLYRYSYDKATSTYTLDAGFPVAVGSPVTETLVIDKDGNGRIWATWNSNGYVYVNHTTGSDTEWGTPFIVPGTIWSFYDDISAVVAFGGDRIGVLSSNEWMGELRFSVHDINADDGQWSSEVIPVGLGADDHLNIKASSRGEVFAAIKNDEQGNNGNAPLTYLVKRSPDGRWVSVPFGVWPRNTRPIVLLDEAAREVHMVATCPQPPSLNAQSGGDICEKVTSMDDPSFDVIDRGTTLISDSASSKMNNVTSTKQGISQETGMVVMATNDATNTIWHNELPLGTALPAPEARFSVGPATGDAPLDVRFSNESAGAPKSWSWNFGDGTTSPSRNPVHRFTEPGRYTVTLTVADELGRTHSVTKADVVAAAQPPPPAPPPPAPAPPPPPPPDRVLRRVTLVPATVTVPYGSAAKLTAAVEGDALGQVSLRVQGSRFPFEHGFADLLPAATLQGAGTRTFTIPRVTTKVIVQAVADNRMNSGLVAVRSAARAKITSLRREAKRVVVRGTVVPATRQGVVVVERRLPSGAFAATRRTTLLKGGRFAIRVTSAGGERLRVTAYPRDNGAHAPGASAERRVPAAVTRPSNGGAGLPSGGT